MSGHIGSSSTLKKTEPDTTKDTYLDQAEENKMGSGVSKQNRKNGNGSDGRNERGDAKGSIHEPMDTSDDTSLLPIADSAAEDHCSQNVNKRLDGNKLDAVLKQQSKDDAEKQKLLDKINKLETENKKLNDELLQERKSAAETKDALDKANKVMYEYTTRMSHIMQLKNTGGHEDANDQFSPTKLGAKMKTVYEDQGLPFLEYFNDEVEGAKFLSSMTKSCYDFCKRKAFSHVTNFCFLDSTDVGEMDEGRLRRYTRKMISGDDFDELCYLRWKTATSEEAINHIKENANTIPFQDETYPRLNTDEVKKAAVKSFFQKCAEICWLIATCRPALHLRFDVENVKYESWIKQAFSVFATQKKVQLHDTPPGVIVAVVCPVLENSDGSIIMRGEVIVNDLIGSKDN